MEVTGLDNLSGGFMDNIPEKINYINGDITDVSLINNIFEKYNYDYVYHLAAYAAEGLSHFIRIYNYTNNILGSVAIINAAIRTKVKCLIFT